MFSKVPIDLLSRQNFSWNYFCRKGGDLLQENTVCSSIKWKHICYTISLEVDFKACISENQYIFYCPGDRHLCLLVLFLSQIIIMMRWWINYPCPVSCITDLTQCKRVIVDIKQGTENLISAFMFTLLRPILALRRLDTSFSMLRASVFIIITISIDKINKNWWHLEIEKAEQNLNKLWKRSLTSFVIQYGTE